MAPGIICPQQSPQMKCFYFSSLLLQLIVVLNASAIPFYLTMRSLNALTESHQETTFSCSVTGRPGIIERTIEKIFA